MWAKLLEATEFWSAIVGSVVGGIVAAVAALVTQRAALRVSREQRDEDRLEARRALAHSILFKVVSLHANTHWVSKHFGAPPPTRDGVTEPWQYVQPLANVPEPVAFSADEMGMLLSLKDDEIFNKTVQADTLHNSLMAAARIYNARREELTRLFTPQAVEGSLFSGDLSQEEWLRLRPHMVVADGLAKDIRRIAAENLAELNSMMPALAQLFQEKLGTTATISLKNSGDSP